MMILTAPSTVEVPGKFFLGGLSLTLLLAVSAIALSFPLGVILALARTSKMPIFRLMSTVYIELVRGVPLITWLIVGFVMFPVLLPPGVEVGGVARAIGAMTFFSAAYLAENVRGGLQSIPKGQYEAAQAMGLSTTQTTVFITLPQALRAVIPALVGQVIALFKDTSLVTLVGLFDFLHIARSVIPNQTQPFVFLGSIKETLLFAAVVYWMFTFTFSRISLHLEKKLGVGER
jgi:general L-amino acid transport system permease protein